MTSARGLPTFGHCAPTDTMPVRQDGSPLGVGPPTTPRISIVIPAFNEADRIGPTLRGIAAHMDARGEAWELIVSDDGSSDSTIETALALGIPNLRVVSAPRNRGKGHAVRAGMTAARGALILFADADESTPISFIDDLIREVEAGAHVAVGSRAADGSLEAAKSFGRRVCSVGLRTLVRALFSLKVKDTQCGFKMFTAESAADLFSRQRIDGFSFDLEVLYLAEQRGWTTVEVPVEWHDAPGSTVSASRVAAQFLLDLTSIRLNDVRGSYDTADSRADYREIPPPDHQLPRPESG